jgi:hypothetical protein
MSNTGANGYHHHLDAVDAVVARETENRPHMVKVYERLSTDLKGRIRLAFTEGDWKDQTRTVAEIGKLPHKAKVGKREGLPDSLENPSNEN